MLLGKAFTSCQFHHIKAAVTAGTALEAIFYAERRLMVFAGGLGGVQTHCRRRAAAWRRQAVTCRPATRACQAAFELAVALYDGPGTGAATQGGIGVRIRSHRMPLLGEAP